MAYVLYLKSLYVCVLTIRYCVWRSTKNCEVSIQYVISHQALCEQVLIITESIHQLKLSVAVTWGGMTCSQMAGSITKRDGEQNLACVGVIGCVYVYEWSGFRRTSKILFGNMVWLSFRWLLVMYSTYM